MPYGEIDDRRAYGREWMRRNPGKAREAMRRWRARHGDQDRAAKRQHYRLNREGQIARVVEYLRAHPEVRRTIRQQRRARELGAVGSYTTAEWRALIQAFGGRCAYCGSIAPLHADHRTPLSRGGSNDIGNIFPACAPCNQRKYKLTEEEFRRRIADEKGATSLN